MGLIVQPRRVDLILSFVLAVQETDNMLWELLSRDSSSFLKVDRSFRVAGRNVEEAAVWARAEAGGELGVRWRGNRGREPRRELEWERAGGGEGCVGRDGIFPANLNPAREWHGGIQGGGRGGGGAECSASIIHPAPSPRSGW